MKPKPKDPQTATGKPNNMRGPNAQTRDAITTQSSEKARARAIPKPQNPFLF